MNRPGSTAQAHCRTCRGRRTWYYAGREGPVATDPSGKYVDLWRCASCGTVRIEMADVTDAEKLVETILDEWTRRNGSGNARFEKEDALGYLRTELWAIYRQWEPTRGVPFLAYGTGMLRFRLADWFRSWLGRHDPKPLAIACSLDAIQGHDDDHPDSGVDRVGGGGLGSPVGSGALDSAADRTSDLRRALSTRRGAIAREDRRLGVVPAERAAVGDPAAA